MKSPRGAPRPRSVVATGVTTSGREVLGVDVEDSEDEVFWRGFLRSLKERGLAGVQLVISRPARRGSSPPWIASFKAGHQPSWLQRAAAAGDERAKSALARVVRPPAGTPVDLPPTS